MMDRSFAMGNGASVSNGPTAPYQGEAADARPVTFWDLIGQGQMYR